MHHKNMQSECKNQFTCDKQEMKISLKFAYSNQKFCCHFNK